MSELRYDGRVAIVTGAGRGMGAAYARLLASRGAKVVIADLGADIEATGTRDPGPAEGVAAEIEAAGGHALPVVADVGDPASAKSIVDAAIEHFGGLDIVINNAGNWQTLPFEDYTPEAFSRDLNSHLWGAWNVCHAAWPHLKERHYGRVLNTTSDAMMGVDNAAGYCAVKGGIVGLTKALAIEGGRAGIKVNAVAPSGGTRTGAFLPEEYQEWRTKYQTPEQVAAGVAWLVHEDLPSTGDIFSCYSGRVGLFFIGQTEGWWTDPAEITPELVRDNFERVVDREHSFVPKACDDSMVTVYGLTNLPMPPAPGALTESLQAASDRT